MFDDKDSFSNMSSGGNNLGQGSSERDKLDIDSEGNSKFDKDNKKRQDQQQQYDQQQKNRNSKFGRNKGMGNGRGNMPKERGIFMSIIIIAVIVGIAVYLPKAYSSGTLTGPLRSIFASPKENTDNFMGAILDMDKTVTDLDKTPEEKEETSIYDKNDLHLEKFLKTQVEPEYMVYIHTGVYELDQPFNEWVEEYETKEPKTKKDSSEKEESTEPKANNNKGKYKIYRLSMEDLESDFEVLEYVDSVDPEPMILIYNTPVKGTKLLDSVVKDNTMLDSIPTYMDKMVERANENWN